jgi:SAM-dependent methyltransferase
MHINHAAYDRIGRAYTATRRPDPRIAAAISAALGEARTVVNVGAGAGAYEPAAASVVAVEPSWLMIRQRSRPASRAVQAVAEALPFRTLAVDAALAVLTVHHWTDWRQGIAEMKRVAKRVVLFTFDTTAVWDFWLTKTYFPEIGELDRKRSPSVAELAGALGDCTIDRIAVPYDCADGFLAAFWRRPEAYLDSNLRAAMSGFALLDENVVARGIARLKSDLESGVWDRNYGYLRSLDALDAGYRLLATDGRTTPRSL